MDADGWVQPLTRHLAPLATMLAPLVPFYDHCLLPLLRDRAAPRPPRRAALKPRREAWVQALHEGGEAKVADLDQQGLCTSSSAATAAAEAAHACHRGSSGRRKGGGGRCPGGAATATQWERGVAAGAAASGEAGAAAHSGRPRPRPRGGRGGVAGR